MAPFCVCPISSVTVSQRAQDQDPETEAAKQNSAIIDFIICALNTLTCHTLSSCKSGVAL